MFYNFLLARKSKDITKPNGNEDLENNMVVESVLHVNEEELRKKDSRIRRMSEDRGD